MNVLFKRALDYNWCVSSTMIQLVSMYCWAETSIPLQWWVGKPNFFLHVCKNMVAHVGHALRKSTFNTQEIQTKILQAFVALLRPWLCTPTHHSICLQNEVNWVSTFEDEFAWENNHGTWCFHFVLVKQDSTLLFINYNNHSWSYIASNMTHLQELQWFILLKCHTWNLFQLSFYWW